MKYSSKTLTELRQSLLKLNKSGALPRGFASQVAEKHSLEVNHVRNGLKGNPAKEKVVMAILNEVEQMLSVKITKPSKRSVSKLTVTDLYDLQLLPAKYSDLAAEVADVKSATVRNFIRNKRKGMESYATSEPIEKALFQIAEMNQEWIMLCRVQNVLESLNAHPSDPQKPVAH